MVKQPIATTDGALLTVKQAAQRLGVSERTVWRMIASNELRHRRVRNSVRFDPRDVQAYIDSQ